MIRGRALLLVALLALAAPAASALIPSPEAGPASAGPQPLRLDLSRAIDATTLLEPRALPAPAQSQGIGPGARLDVLIGDDRIGCTAAFVYEEGSRLLLGTAGHCLLPATARATHGPGADADASATQARVCVSRCAYGGQTGFFLSGDLVDLGPVVYARQESPEGDSFGHDFGLVEIPAHLHALVRAELPVFGGPTAATPGRIETGMPLCHYGAGVVTGEAWPVMARVGAAHAGSDPASWWAETATNGGDSGSAVVRCDLRGDELRGAGALGILTHGVGTLTWGTNAAQAVRMAREDAGLEIRMLLASP